MPAGRPRKPTHLKVLTGNPGKRKLPENEPAPPPQAKPPGPPAYLKDKTARKEWKRVAPILHAMKVLTLADITALAAYCTAFARWQYAEDKLAAAILIDDLVSETDNGYPVQNAYLAIANKAMEQMHKFMVEFGLSPASRSRVKTVETPKDDPMEAYLKRGKASR
ncbi:MAG: phage terminase small subunit P27 family [Armatimonadota bacterium]